MCPTTGKVIFTNGFIYNGGIKDCQFLINEKNKRSKIVSPNGLIVLKGDFSKTGLVSDSKLESISSSFLIEKPVSRKILTTGDLYKLKSFVVLFREMKALKVKVENRNKYLKNYGYIEAAKSGKYNDIFLAKEYHASQTIADGHGNTPLHYAIKYQRKNLLYTLLTPYERAIKRIEVLNNAGQKPIDMCPKPCEIKKIYEELLKEPTYNSSTNSTPFRSCLEKCLTGYTSCSSICSSTDIDCYMRCKTNWAPCSRLCIKHVNFK